MPNQRSPQFLELLIFRVIFRCHIAENLHSCVETSSRLILHVNFRVYFGETSESKSTYFVVVRSKSFLEYSQSIQIISD